jgi:alditol oxidase
MTTLSLDVCPTFEVEQRVFEGLTWKSLLARFHRIMASGYSVSIFTRWDDHSQVWVKRRCGDPVYDLADTTARAADGPRHPVPELSAANCTEQLGIPAPWYERLPHFRPEFRPATGHELQSEYLVAKIHAVAALESLRRIRTRFGPVLQTSEIRTVASDECWLSPSYQRDSVAIHFTWSSDMAKVASVLAEVEEALAPFDPRPHWGKLFSTGADTLAASYPKWADFDALMRRLDPAGKFRNDFVDD